MIPKITHQTAAESKMPDLLTGLRERMKALHPGWDHRFYDDAACREHIRREMPCILGVYDSFPSNIQRADFFRVVAIYIDGGFYLDTDVNVHQPLDPLCGAECVLGVEKTLSLNETKRLNHKNSVRIANYMFGSEPGHPFWLDVLSEMLQRMGQPIRTENDILETTGPGLLTSIFHHVKDRYPEIKLLKEPGTSCPRCRAVSCKFGDYASHYHAGSWRWGQRSFQAAPHRDRSTLSAAKLKRAFELLNLRRRAPATVEKVVILNTYQETAHDGLSNVFQKVADLGKVVDDTSSLSGRTVLVAGIPFLYTHRISPDNTNVLFTTFESNHLPSHWVEAINKNYDVCVVPHEAVREIFETSGVNIPLQIVQQGFTRYPRLPDVIPRDDIFRIGFLGVPVRRKNLRQLFQACEKLAQEIPGLQLAVHVSEFYEWMDSSIWEDVRESPFVDWSEGIRTKGEIAKWYQGLTCYVYPSSAEGWSFTPRESTFLGIPTVLSDIPPHRELLDTEFCTKIPVDGVEVAQFEGGTFGEWYTVRADDIYRVLREVYRDIGPVIERARKGADWIEDNWLDADTRRSILKLLQRS